MSWRSNHAMVLYTEHAINVQRGSTAIRHAGGFRASVSFFKLSYCTGCLRHDASYPAVPAQHTHVKI